MILLRLDAKGREHWCCFQYQIGLDFDFGGAENTKDHELQKQNIWHQKMNYRIEKEDLDLRLQTTERKCETKDVNWSP